MTQSEFERLHAMLMIVATTEAEDEALLNSSLYPGDL